MTLKRYIVKDINSNMFDDIVTLVHVDDNDFYEVVTLSGKRGFFQRHQLEFLGDVNE